MTEYLKSIITGSYDKYPNKFNIYFSKYGNSKILKLVIERVPLQQTTMILLNLASNNSALERLKQSDYDKLFHLRLIIYLDNNISLFVEKNQSLNIDYYKNLVNQKGIEQLEINEVPTSQLFNFINNGKNILKDKFFSYDAKNNNCQDWILALLISNNINNNEYKNFIKQDVNFIFKNNQFLKSLIQSLTSIGHRFDVISGNGINKLNFNKPLDNFEIQDICNKMKIKLNGIYARNQKIDLKNGNYILNLDSYGKSGTHWTCFIKDKNNIYYFDSFGSYPPLEITELCDKYNLNLYYNKDDIQDYKSILCGYFCISLFHYIKTNKTKNIIDRLNDFISLFKKTNTKKNDDIIKNYIKKFYV
jgi:hypothetical protein